MEEINMNRLSPYTAVSPFLSTKQNVLLNTSNYLTPYSTTNQKGLLGRWGMDSVVAEKQTDK